MKFYRALLLLSSTLSLTLASGLDISDGDFAGNTFNSGLSGEVSDAEGPNTAPVENLPNLPPVPQTEQPAAPSLPPVPSTSETIPQNDTPVDLAQGSPVDVAQQPSSDAAGVLGQDQAAGELSDGPAAPAADASSINNAPVQSGDASGISGRSQAAGEASDDYGAEPAADGVAGAAVSPIDQLDNASAEPAEVGDGAGIAAEGQGEDSDPEAAGEDDTKAYKVASGIAGAAALSSAGIFLWVKKSKRSGLQSVRTQISMV